MEQVLQAHIQLCQDDAATWAILPGDPARVDRIQSYLTDVKELKFNREFKSISGYYKGVKVLAVSTGVGGASMGIAVEELHNIGVQGLIRIGSCGALKPGIGLGELILVNGAVRHDGASNTYVESAYPAVPDTETLVATIDAAKKLGATYHIGLGRSHDSFYTDSELEICDYWGARDVLGADLETAALFVIGRLRGLKTASILNNVVLAQADVNAGVADYVDGDGACANGEKLEILTALEAIVEMSSNK